MYSLTKSLISNLTSFKIYNLSGEDCLGLKNGYLTNLACDVADNFFSNDVTEFKHKKSIYTKINAFDKCYV